MSIFTVHKGTGSGVVKVITRVVLPVEVARIVEPLVFPKQYPLKEVQMVHEQLIDKMKDSKAGNDREKVKAAARVIINDLRLQYTSQECDEFASQVADESIGHGPIEALIREDRITDININGPKEIFCEVDGINRRTPYEFRDDDHLKHHIVRIVSAVGRRVDESSPIVDARLKDGSRFHAILPPLSLIGPAVSIRKFGTHKIRGPELIEKTSVSPWMLEFLEAAIKARLSMVISGGTGAGKTTLLNTLAMAIPITERLVTIENPAELQINRENIVPLEARPANLEGEGAITQRQLVVGALRMKPDRIIVGECREGEAFDMLQAMNTGHDGSLSTVHANSPREALARLESMVLMAGTGLSAEAIKQQIASAIRLVVQVVRMSDGSRRITAISEITCMQEAVISMQDIFLFEQKAVEVDGRIHGTFLGNGIMPQCIKSIELSGKKFEPGFFTQRMEV